MVTLQQLKYLELHLEKCGLCRPASMEHITKSLQPQLNLIKLVLHFQQNFFGFQGVAYLAQFLEGHPRLTSLDLDLSSNSLGAASSVHVVASLPTITQLESL